MTWPMAPADREKNAKQTVRPIILAAFKALEMRHPETNTKQREILRSMRRGAGAGKPGLIKR